MTLKQKKHIIAWIMRWTLDQAFFYVVETGNYWSAGSSLLEPILARDAYVAVYYAQYHKKSRFKQAESVIAGDPQEAARYAIRVLKRRWLKGEKAIFKHSFWSIEYGKFLKKKEGLHDEVRD